MSDEEFSDAEAKKWLEIAPEVLAILRARHHYRAGGLPRGGHPGALPMHRIKGKE
jgi:hypothetical protein